MNDTAEQVADRLFGDPPCISITGNNLKTWVDWYELAEEWTNAHKSWSVEDIYNGIKYFGYCFPDNITLNQIYNVSIDKN